MIECTTLAALKAANPTELGAHLADPSLNGLFAWAQADFTGKADDLYIVESSGIPLSMGAWVRQDAKSLSFIQAGAGGVKRSASSKISDTLHARDFGAVGDGSTDDTDAIASLLAAMQDQGKPGILGAEGTETRYLVRTGELRWTFSNVGGMGLPACPGPRLDTAGKVTLVVKTGSDDAPILSVHNDPAAGGSFVHGGHIGALCFEDTTADTASGRHGLYLHGVQFMHFGAMHSSALKGDLCHIARIGDETNADGWHVFSCAFAGLFTEGTEGWTLNNDSVSQVFNFCRIETLWNIGGKKGLWKGPGACNYCVSATTGYNQGWAIDWTADSGTVQFGTIETLELDSPEYGIKVIGVQGARFNSVRVTHRKNEVGGQLEDPTHVWPKTVVSLGGIAGRTTNATKLHLINNSRSLDVGDNSSFGIMVDFNNDTGVYGTQIETVFVGNAPGVRIPIANYIANLPATTSDNKVTYFGAPILDQSLRNAVIARVTSGNSSNDYATIVPFDSVALDQAGSTELGASFSTSTHAYSAPATGIYSMHAQVMLTGLSDGELVRLGLRINGTLVRETRANASAATAQQSFSVAAIHPLSANDQVTVSAYSDSGRAFGAGNIDVASNNFFEIHLI